MLTDNILAALDASRVVGVANAKGGTGKTSTTVNLAGNLAQANHAAGDQGRVLIIDLDPQGDVGDDLGYLGTDIDDQGDALNFCLQARTPKTLQPVPVPGRPNLDVVPGGECLNDLVSVLQGRDQAPRVEALARALAPALAPYDWVFIDSPPTNPVLQDLTLVASRWLLVPTTEDKSGRRAVYQIVRRMVNLHDYNPTVELLAVVLFNSLTSSHVFRAEARDELEANLGGVAPLFETFIRNSTAAKRARGKGRTAAEYESIGNTQEPWWARLRDPGKHVGDAPVPPSTSGLAQDYIDITNALVRTIAEREQFQAVQS